MTTHEILVEARNVLERRGLWKLPTGGPPGGRCMLTAVSEVGRRVSPEVLRALGFENQSDVAHWNDAPERTKEQVLAAFDKAITATAPEPQDPFTEDDFSHTPDAVAIP